MLDTAALEENGHFPDILRQIAFMLLTIKQRLIKVVSAFMTCILKEYLIYSFTCQYYCSVEKNFRVYMYHNLRFCNRIGSNDL